MYKHIFTGAMLALCMHATAQTKTAQEFANTITVSDLHQHLAVLTAPDMEGRETGMPGQAKAGNYIASQFAAIGLAPLKGTKNYQQFYPLYSDSLMSSTLSFNGKPAEFVKDYITPLTNNATGKFKASEIVFAGYGIKDDKYNDYANLNVKNKVVIFFAGEPKVDGKYLISGTARYSKWTFPGASEKLATAKALGARGVLMINQNAGAFNDRALRSSRRTAMYFPEATTGKTKNLNYAILSQEAAQALLNNESLFANAKDAKPFASQNTILRTKVNFSIKTSRETSYASNVVGMVEGTDKKNEYVFITGHYDHLGVRNGNLYPGADDDGSGTCGVIEMAQAFVKAKEAGSGPRRTVIFMTVSGEEKGLWGSEYYSDHPLVSLDKTSADLNIDMVGRTDTERNLPDTGNYVYVIGHDKLSSDLAVINEAANKASSNITLDYKYDDPTDQNRIYYRSDHYNFARKGVPILFFYDGMLKADYHKPTDTIDKIHWSLYQKRVQMIFYTAWEIANRDAMLKRDIPLTMPGR